MKGRREREGMQIAHAKEGKISNLPTVVALLSLEQKPSLSLVLFIIIMCS